MQLEAGEMTEQHAMPVQRTFGWPGRPRGVDHQRRIVWLRHGGLEAAHAVCQCTKRNGAGLIAPFCKHDQSQFRQFVAASYKPFIAEAIGDDRCCARILEAISKRLDAEEQCQRQRDGAHLVNSRMGDRRLKALRQEDSNAIAGAHAVRGKAAGKGGRARCERTIGKRSMRSIRAEMLQADPVRIAGRPGVADRHADVERLRNPPAKFAKELVVVFDLR